MIDTLDRLTPRHKSNEVTLKQRDLALRVKGTITPGIFSKCQVITATHVYLVNKSGQVTYSSRRARHS